MRRRLFKRQIFPIRNCPKAPLGESLEESAFAPMKEGNGIPNNERLTPPRMNQSRTPPEDQNPRGCSLHSMEPLRDWFCKGADMTSAAEYLSSLLP